VLLATVFIADFVTVPRLGVVPLPHWIEAVNEPLAPFAARMLTGYVR
jgi:hypothetical protein